MNHPSLNHGNFLELLKFTANRDSILNEYLKLAIDQSKKRKTKLDSQSKTSKGRGNLVTLLSKTTVNKVIDAIVLCMRRIIRTELSDKQFSIQVKYKPIRLVFYVFYTLISFIFRLIAHKTLEQKIKQHFLLDM